MKNILDVMNEVTTFIIGSEESKKGKSNSEQFVKLIEDRFGNCVAVLETN